MDVKALDEKGKPIEFRCGGLLARAVQHEADHLNGILFIDRMDKKTKAELQPELDELQAQDEGGVAEEISEFEGSLNKPSADSTAGCPVRRGIWRRCGGRW